MSNEDHHDELDPQTREYFYGKDDGKEVPIVPPELLVTPETTDDLKKQLAKVNSELETIFENVRKHEINKSKHSDDKIDEDGLPFDVQHAEKAEHILKDHKKNLEDILHQKTPPSKGIKGTLLSFLGLLP